MGQKYGKGNVDRIGRLWVLHLKGTSFERGLQHGTLMRYRVRDTVNFYRMLPEFLAEKTSPPGSSRYRSVGKLKRKIASGFTKDRDSDALEETRGLAVGLGMKQEHLAEALVLSDVIQCLGASAGKRKRSKPVLPGLGCTSAVRETPGELQFARNFDFWGAGYWDENPAVIFHHPDRDKAFCSISTAGFPTGGITAVNEEGLAVAVHQHGSLDFNHKGTPMLDIAHSVVRKAGTVDEAIDVASRFCPTGGWTLVIAGGGKAAALEMSAVAQKPRWMSDHILVATNRFEDDDLASREVHPSLGAAISSRARFQRASDLMSGPRPGASRMVGVLGDHFDVLAGCERSAGYTISRITNLSSVLFSLHNKRFWVSESPAPTSKGSYVGFDLEAELGGGSSSVDRLEGGRPPAARTTSAQDRYLDAYKEYMGSGDLNRVLMVLAECSGIDPAEPTFPFMEGIARAKVGNYRGALSSLNKSLGREKAGPKNSVALLWKARILDLLDRTEDSAGIYTDLAVDPDSAPVTSESATRGIKKRYREKDLSDVLMDFANGDVYSV